MKYCRIETKHGKFVLRDTHVAGLETVMLDEYNNVTAIINQHFYDIDDDKFWDEFDSMSADEMEEFFSGILKEDVREYMERRGVA